MVNIPAIRTLLRRIPHPPEEELPAGLSDQECTRFEERTGLVMPPDLRAWLNISNGPCVGPGGLYGVCPPRMHLDIESYYDMYPTWRTRGWIPVAGDGCGNQYVLVTKREYGNGLPIVFVESTSDHEMPAYIVASDIRHFLLFLFLRELGQCGWPFDEAIVTQNDPAIMTFHDVPLPWQGKTGRESIGHGC